MNGSLPWSTEALLALARPLRSTAKKGVSKAHVRSTAKKGTGKDL